MSSNSLWACMKSAFDGVNAIEPKSFVFDQPRHRAREREVVNGVGIIRISGAISKAPTILGMMLGRRTYDDVIQEMDGFASDDSVKAVVSIIDSPGGTVAGMSDAVDAMRRLNAVKPVLAFASDTMASAAYAIGSQATKLYADRDAIVGSIGTLLIIEDLSAMADNMGIKVHAVSSGKFKGAGIPGTEVTEAHLEDFQRTVNSLADLFIDDVAAGRGLPREAVEKLATGQVWVGQEAVDNGLIDGIRNLDQVITEASSQQNRGTAMDPVQETKKTVAKDTKTEVAVPVAETVTDTTDHRAEERQRIMAIHDVAKRHDLGAEWANAHINSGASIGAVHQSALDKIAEMAKPIETGTPFITVGDDKNRATLAQAIEDGIAMRANTRIPETDQDGFVVVNEDTRKAVTRKPHDRARSFRGMSMIEMGKAYLQAIGATGWEQRPRQELAEILMHPMKLWRTCGAQPFAVGHAVGDFPSILGNVVGRTLRMAYAEAPSTWERWARRGTVPDFRPATRAQLSEMSSLTERPTGQETQYTALLDSGQTIFVRDFTGGVKLTRQALINDDLNAFSRLPLIEGAAAKRTEDNVAYEPITNNQTMAETSAALFSATHGNLETTGGPPTVARIGAGWSSMKLIAGLKEGTHLGIEPRFLLVPPQLEIEAMQLIGSPTDPAGDNPSVVNPFHNRLEVIGEPRLTLRANGDVRWYLIADNSMIDTVEVVFLEDQPAPILQSEENMDTGSWKYHITHTVGSAAIDYRGMYENDGA